MRVVRRCGYGVCKDFGWCCNFPNRKTGSRIPHTNPTTRIANSSSVLCPLSSVCHEKAVLLYLLVAWGPSVLYPPLSGWILVKNPILPFGHKKPEFSLGLINRDDDDDDFSSCTVACVTRPERPKGAKDEVKQARRAKSRPEGPQTRGRGAEGP